MRQPKGYSRNEDMSWSRRSPLSQWLTRFALRWQWGLATLVWSVLAVVACGIDLAWKTDKPLLEILLFGIWLLPGAVMVIATAARNTWVRLVDHDRFERDHARASYAEFRRHPAELSPALYRKTSEDWDFRKNREY